MRIDTDPGVIQELYDRLSFDVPGAKFMPKFKKRLWDGKVHLLNKRNNTIHKGLAHYVESYAKENDYAFVKDFSNTSFNEEVADDFISKTKWFNNDKIIEPRDYQLEAIKRGITNKRYIALSPTGSGKSLIIASLIKFYHDNEDGNILLICPTTSLVEQMYSDISDYFPYWEPQSKITRIYSGMVREQKRIVISTWQSIYDNPESWFSNFSVVIGDETHLYSAKEVSKLFEKCVNAEYRFGFTGTLSGQHLHQLQLEGLFGKAFQITTTSKLIKNKQLSDFKINALVFSYSEKTKKDFKRHSWEEEVQFIISNEKRNKYIAKLASSLKGNTLVLFSRVESHGKVIFDILKEITDRPVFFIFGGTETEIREEVRKSLDNITDAIIVASSQIFSTGINIPTLKNIIFTHPSKSRIKTLQSIGRVLRISDKKSGPSVLFDLVDDLRYKNKVNYAFNHFKERIKIYAQEDFEYKIIDIELEK